MARDQKISNQGWNVQQVPAAPAKQSTHSKLHASAGNGYYIKIALAIAVVLVGLAINLDLPSSSELGSFSTSSSRIVVALATVGVALKGYNVLFLMAIPALYAFFNYVKRKCDVTKRMRVVSIVVAFLFAVFMVVGYSFLKMNGFDLMDASLGQLLKSLLVIAGYWVLLAYAIEWLYCWLGVKRHRTISKHVGKVMHFVFDKAPFWIPFAIICVFWLPRLIAFYPGLLMGDSRDQVIWICNWFKTGDISSLHNNDPLIHTLLMALGIKIGLAWIQPVSATPPPV